MLSSLSNRAFENISHRGSSYEIVRTTCQRKGCAPGMYQQIGKHENQGKQYN